MGSPCEAAHALIEAQNTEVSRPPRAVSIAVRRFYTKRNKRKPPKHVKTKVRPRPGARAPGRLLHETCTVLAHHRCPGCCAMHHSIEEEEITAQRDAAMALCKGLQEKVLACSSACLFFSNLAQARVGNAFAHRGPTLSGFTPVRWTVDTETSVVRAVGFYLVVVPKGSRWIYLHATCNAKRSSSHLITFFAQLQLSTVPFPVPVPCCRAVLRLLFPCAPALCRAMVRLLDPIRFKHKPRSTRRELKPRKWTE